MSATTSHRRASVATGGRRERTAAMGRAFGGALRAPATVPRESFAFARPLGDVDFDDVRGAGDVDGRPRGNDDRVAGCDEAACLRGVQGAVPQILDVLAFRDPDRGHAPL